MIGETDGRRFVSGAALILIAASLASGAHAEGNSGLGALRETKPIIDFRLRSESVEQDGIAEDASAVTLRGRLGFETGKAWKTSLLVEGDLLLPIDTDYNSTVNGKTAYPVVADPESYELNRLQLVNTALPGTTLVVGRQRIILDDHRFVGNVGWRQHEQTYDSVRLTNKSMANLTVDVAYVDQVNRIFSKDSPVGRFEGDNYLANLSYPTPIGKLVGFAYLLDFDLAPADSSATYGLRLTGEKPVQKVKVAYAVSYATQNERADNPLDYSADYYAFEVTGKVGQYSLGAGIEILEGDGTKGFTTPLATLHKFQGWADKFLGTPPNGMDDRYVTLGYTKKGFGIFETFAAAAVYHVYESQRAAIDYGSELDLQVQAKWRRFNGILKYADYDADALATDTSKLWLQVEYVW